MAVGILLVFGLGYGGYTYRDSAKQSKFQSRVNKLSEESSRFDVPVQWTSD